MKKHLSILALWVRSTFLGAALILLIAAAAETALLWGQLGAVRSGEMFPEFAELVNRSRIRYLYAAGLTALWGWLLYMGCAARRNTLGRLNVAEEKITLWHGACCVGWLVIFWAVQVGVVLAGYRMFLGVADPLAVSGQSLFLACCQDELLHWLLPLVDRWTAVWVLTANLTLGFTAAVDGYCWRRGKRLFSFLSFLPWAILTLGPIFGESTVPWALAVMLIVIVFINISRLYRGWRED